MTAAWFDRLPVPGLQTVTPVGGGDVNQAYRLDTASGTVFLLTQAHVAADFYAGEVAGLNAFAAADVLAPRVLNTGVLDDTAYLLLTYLAPGQGDQADLGRLVAKLHHAVSPTGRFGFDYPYAGSSVSFANTWTDSWVSAFLARLDHLESQLNDKAEWNDAADAHYQAARFRIQSTLSQHASKPVLLHGDLWSGNVMFTATGEPALIDPAAWYGDAEFDLAITTVFGGFAPAFYEAYLAANPLASGYQYRSHFYRLYYLMVHLDKFGASYARSVEAELNAILA